jgi:hypothetical protein
VLSPSVARFAFLAVLARAVCDEAVSAKAGRRALLALSGGVNLTWHFEATTKQLLGDAPLAAYEHPTTQSRFWEARARWIIYLLRNDGVVSVQDVAKLFSGPSPELLVLAAKALTHPHRDVRDPALRYASELPQDEALVEPMLRVQEAKYGWQERAAMTWLEPWKGTPAYARAVAAVRAG